jgi:ketosteroid isomerase-like protein
MRTRIAFLAALVACSSALAARRLPAYRYATASSADSDGEIRAVLAAQTEAWNRADMDAFMNGYWKSDSTLFIGAHGILRGWQAVLGRYHRLYSDPKAMGHLTFSNLEVHVQCADAAFVVGEFHLQREHDHPSGVFTLDFKKFPEGWRIVADHTTGFPSAPPAK